MAGHKRAILDKYADYLRHKYEHKGWDVDIVERHNNGYSGVWGIIHLFKTGKAPVVIRVHPWRGIDKVTLKGKRYFKEKTVMTRRQLQYSFGYAPTWRTRHGDVEEDTPT
ncbi:MAG: hypothetical protein ACXAEN_17810 [Candidatus Thorarchaeota archaeon]|jgi:hypothetical protein